MNYTNWKNLPDRTTPLTAENLLNDINITKEEIQNLKSEISKIIESGDNENGSFIKYSNGIMICLQSIEGIVNISTAWGSLYQSGILKTPNFPEQFIDAPYVLLTNHNGESVIAPNGLSTNSKPEDVVLLRGTTSPDMRYKIDILSIGKWK